MLSDELKGIRTALGELMGKVDDESAELLRVVRRNLEAAADEAENMENNFYPITEVM